MIIMIILLVGPLAVLRRLRPGVLLPVREAAGDKGRRRGAGQHIC